MSLLTLTPAEFCKATQACKEGRDFAVLYPTMAEVWYNCPHPEWLLWVCDKIGQRPDDRTLRLFAVWCARNTPLGDGRVTGDLLTDPRSIAAIDISERYANGIATLEELAAAEAAARAAGDAAWATEATEAAGAAAWAAEAAARAAARVAARAAWAAGDAALAARADAEAARKTQADQVRRMVPNPFRKEGQSWGIDEIIQQHLREGGTPT